MPFIHASEAPTFELHGAIFTGLAAPSRGASETSVWRVKLPPHSGNGQPHQLTREEILVALAGSATAKIGGEAHVFAAGDAIVIPAFTDFALDNAGAEGFEAVAVLPVGGRAMLPDTAPFSPPWAR